MPAGTGVYRNVYRSGDHATEPVVLIGTVYNNGHLTGTLSASPPPPTPDTANVFVDLVDQFGAPVVGAQVYATTKAFQPVPGTDDQGIIEKKDEAILTDATGRASLILIKGSAFADTTNNKYIISYTLDRQVYRFEYLVTDADSQVATQSL